MSKLGLMSRGEAAKAIAAGKVTVNDRVITDARTWVDWQSDAIECLAPREDASPASAGRPPSHHRHPDHRYGLLYKPRGVVVTRSDELGRGQEVYGLLPAEAREGWLFAVGRLDKESEGLLLFTSDGAWADALTGPASHATKVYRVKLNARVLAEDLARFRSGILLDGSMTLPCEAEIESGNWVKVVLREGRNRQIRRMFHALGYKVTRLLRVAIGPVSLEPEFQPGSFRWLTEAEVKALSS